MTPVDHIRNVAIIAHIDHGKTTLIDSVFRAAHAFRENQRVAERVMDSYELERERGITIRAKHCSVHWKDYLINIVDTPGHADFSGEVERVLSMVDSELLLVDANEGPMPQTRYVLMRALRLGLRPIVIINKVDRPTARTEMTLDQTLDLFIELGADDHQAEFPVLYGSGLNGWLSRKPNGGPQDGMEALFETIVDHVPPPNVDQDGPFLMQVSSLAWSDYIGRIGCGRVLRGRLKAGDEAVRLCSRWKQPGVRSAGWEPCGSHPERLLHLWVTKGIERTPVEEVSAGDICWVGGAEDINIGDTLSAPGHEDATLPPLEIEEPTVSIFLMANNGPFSGQEGKAITMRQIRDRLNRELNTNVALRVEDLGLADRIKVSGRGELHLAILIEEMRREGVELCVSRPEVITRREDGRLLEPIETLVIDAPDEYQGVIIEKLSRRKAEMTSMHNAGSGLLRMEFTIPTRGLIGFRSEFLTDTRGLGVMSSRFSGYGAWRGDMPGRSRGSLVSMETGPATAYQIESLQERTVLFVSPTERVYAGQIVGENSRPGDMPCNPTKTKKLTNHRQSNKEATVTLNAPRRMSLDQALEWIADDELVEVTPKSIRVRKAILDADTRKKLQRRQPAEVA
ncbi:MAG TPA: translational GTPase TypA [Candidatus Brocadiia bacterium]|nr:translational GTPase TypA [Candidatus Brocadiia bacterium]